MFERIPLHIRVRAVQIGNTTPTLRQDLVTTRRFGFWVGLMLAALAGWAVWVS